jgi:hypothetical protein
MMTAPQFDTGTIPDESDIAHTQDQAASLPYAGTSGFSGTNASMDRALKNDSTGKTGRVQGMVTAFARSWASHWVTIKDLRAQFPGEHHGTLSGALTALHQDGRLIRLAEQRDRCSIYVAPGFEGVRETLDPAKPKKRTVVEFRRSELSSYIGLKVLGALSEGADEVVVRWER